MQIFSKFFHGTYKINSELIQTFSKYNFIKLPIIYHRFVVWRYDLSTHIFDRPRPNSNARLILIGGARNRDDFERIDRIKNLAKELKIDVC